MVMSDAVKSLLMLGDAPRENLHHHVYNVTSFSPTAGEFLELVRTHWPEANVTFEPDAKRQAIVDTWPAEVNDDAARDDWGWEPEYDLAQAFHEYLVPGVEERYGPAERR